jgi:hypothetical protein
MPIDVDDAIALFVEELRKALPFRPITTQTPELRLVAAIFGSKMCCGSGGFGSMGKRIQCPTLAKRILRHFKMRHGSSPDEVFCGPALSYPKVQL